MFVKLWGADGTDLLHICFDHRNEYDTYIVFDKKGIFSAFCSKCVFKKKKNYETYLHSSVAKKECVKLE